MGNSVILECPRCLNLFAVSMHAATRVGEKLFGSRCRCGYWVEWDTDYMEQVSVWAQPHIANRIVMIENYKLMVQGLAWAKERG